jgi:predicted ABC-type ATPase
MNFKEWLNFTEAAADEKYAFRAVFMAGGPGSGKSTLRDQIFGVNQFRIADSDRIQEFFARRKNGSLEPRGRDFEKSQQLNIKRTSTWSEAGYPLIIDITGRDLSLVYQINNKLISTGYDTGMVFVYADLETSINRNQNRQRQADVDYLKQAWSDAQENVAKFKELFRERFVFINNSSTVEPKLLSKTAYKVLGRPYQVINPIGRQKIQQTATWKNAPRIEPIIFPKKLPNDVPATVNS